MKILAIDPGPAKSAWVAWSGERIVGMGHHNNGDVINMIAEGRTFDSEHMAIEMIASFGMAVGKEVFETVYWIGRFVEAYGAIDCTRIYRMEVKMHFCNSARAKDSNIRQAIIDRFGGPDAIGKKKTPGPLYGVSGDVWSALAVGLTFADKIK